ncbi:peptide ABC transporter substrate-binding protein [Lactiplantibacillus garii]|uniref:Peptide ABC transporter substrate-binding protein n=1 Tax=Lactiplantibacillus garii TaxID=2306423 RepID=A0A426D8K0_9LACO|nr:peptide ABC transporter substrate-binding protein [Lactiplantibacillus garii]RRK10944.1 peptide ABC transporter substrate-binding protein [Lactiplantibacillus garii]
MSLSTTQKTLLTVAGIAIVGGIAFTVNAQSKPAKTATAQTLNLSEGTAIMSLDPAKITDNVSGDQLNQIDEGLYRLNAKSEPVNALATKTTISKDGKEYVIKLHHNAKWSNGQRVTAHDFVYSWERTLDPKSKSEFTYLFSNIKNADAISTGKKSPTTLGVKANGDYQLTITLSKPAAYFKKVLANTTFYPVNQKAVQKYGRAYGTTADKTVYNGAFVMKGWTGTNDTWTLTKNPHYYAKNVVKLNKINYQVIKSTTTAYNLYQSNKLDTVTLSGEQNVQNKNNAERKTLPTGTLEFIQFNEKDKTAANQALRTAVSLAINRNQLVNKVLENGSRPAKTFAVTNMAKNPQTGRDFTQDAYVKNTVDFNVAKAQTLYKQAKRQLGTNQITLTLTCGDNDSTHQVAEFIQGQLMSHLPGIKVNVKAMPFTAMLGKVSKGDFQLNLAGWNMDFADPSRALTILTSSSNSNMGHYNNKAFDQLMKKADDVDALNVTKRYQDLVQAAKRATKDQAGVSLYEGSTNMLVKSNLKGVVYNNFSGVASYRTAYLK